jgi:hypothetical protein
MLLLVGGAGIAVAADNRGVRVSGLSGGAGSISGKRQYQNDENGYTRDHCLISIGGELPQVEIRMADGLNPTIANLDYYCNDRNETLKLLTPQILPVVRLLKSKQHYGQS